MSPHKIECLPSPAALQRYGITRNGFLPECEPLNRLPDPCYARWESLIDNISFFLLDGDAYRRIVDELPVLSTDRLGGESEYQRAYSILAVLVQGYIWGGKQPAERLPPSLAIPFLKVSDRLEVHAVATYAALNLWNFEASSNDWTNPDNLRSLHTATGTADESWFFVVSNAMEARGAPLLHRMLSAMEAAERGDVQEVFEGLQFLGQSLVEIGRLLERMDEHCDPQVFYHQIRPMLAGSKNMEHAGLPNGVFFDEGNGCGSWRKYRGGSNGQSSLIQFFDVVLGVDHGRATFYREMREYMPGPHARFLDDLESVANIRAFAESRIEDTQLTAAYNTAVASLSSFRDKHIQLVTRYIILPSRQSTPTRTVNKHNLATASSSAGPAHKDLIGTGGTTLVPFLKGSRDETSASIISQ